ncbi:MAG: aminotransferase class IV [Deltaproteobacteria bacterium]|nr:aminotransferase class IV [Deltaproteobacteria bacterium]
MTTIVSIDGKLVPPEGATISVFDRGFLYGDSVYEVVRTYQGRPFELGAHLDRLAHSAARIGLRLPWSREQLTRAVNDILEASGHGAQERESYLRIVVTRGSGEIGLDPSLAVEPRTILIARVLEQPAVEAYREGVTVALVGGREGLRRHVDPSAKTGNYLPNVLAVAEARERHAYEAVMVDERDRLTEGSSSNVFLVQFGIVRTPPLAVGILEGVTRRTVIEVCREAKIPVEEARLTTADLHSADEAFLTSSIREIVPITRVEDQPVGTGKVGDVTRAVQAAFRGRTGPPFGEPRF